MIGEWCLWATHELRSIHKRTIQVTQLYPQLNQDQHKFTYRNPNLVSYEIRQRKLISVTKVMKPIHL